MGALAASFGYQPSMGRKLLVMAAVLVVAVTLLVDLVALMLAPLKTDRRQLAALGLLIACIPCGVYVGRMINEVDWKYRRCPRYESTVQRIALADLSPDAEGCLALPDDLAAAGDHVAAWKDASHGLIVAFPWYADSLAGGYAYFSAGESNDLYFGSSGFRRMNETWFMFWR